MSRKYKQQNRNSRPRAAAKPKNNASAKLPTGRTSITTMDHIVNQLARIGTPDALLQQNHVQASRITQDYATLEAMYRSDWIARKVIDTIPEDATKNWYELTCQIEPDQVKQLDTLERNTHVKQKIMEGLKLGRLYGGAAGIIVIKGHEDMLEEPLDIEMIQPDSFRGIIIADRWNGVYPSTEMVEDLDDPDFGLPDYYTFSVNGTELESGVRVHHSRVLRFEGRYLPFNEKLAENSWGMSEIEHIEQELTKRNTASENIAHLIFTANLRVLKMNDLGQMLSLGTEETQRDLYNTVAAQNELMNNMSIQLLDREDDFQSFQYTFSGLSDIYEQFMNDISGASEIPATRLFGRSPQGMNATGESDMRTYYDTVKQWQEANLRPVFEKLLPIECMSVFGAIPDDLGFDFAPIRDTSDEERSSMIQQTASAINSIYQSGLISQRTALKELRDAGEPLGMWTNITDEDIEEASDVSGGEEQGGDPMGGMGGMPGADPTGGDPMAAMMGGIPEEMPQEAPAQEEPDVASEAAHEDVAQQATIPEQEDADPTVTSLINRLAKIILGK